VKVETVEVKKNCGKRAETRSPSLPTDYFTSLSKREGGDQVKRKDVPQMNTRSKEDRRLEASKMPLGARRAICGEGLRVLRRTPSNKGNGKTRGEAHFRQIHWFVAFGRGKFSFGEFTKIEGGT